MIHYELLCLMKHEQTRVRNRTGSVSNRQVIHGMRTVNVSRPGHRGSMLKRAEQRSLKKKSWEKSSNRAVLHRATRLRMVSQ